MLGTSSTFLNERDTLTALSERHRASLQRYFERRVKNRGDAEDLIQEVFLRLARRGDFQSIKSIDGYLFEIAASVFQDLLRHRHSRAVDLHEEFREWHSPEGFSAERVLIGEESVGQVAQALSELPERVRVAFVLHRFEGLRHPEIAKQLRVSVSAVEKYVGRALAFIKERMGEETGDETGDET
jgi:RNA polymerase sigma factor (sigma-70 family)